MGWETLDVHLRGCRGRSGHGCPWPSTTQTSAALQGGRQGPGDGFVWYERLPCIFHGTKGAKDSRVSGSASAFLNLIRFDRPCPGFRPCVRFGRASCWGSVYGRGSLRDGASMLEESSAH